MSRFLAFVVLGKSGGRALTCTLSGANKALLFDFIFQKTEPTYNEDIA